MGSLAGSRRRRSTSWTGRRCCSQRDRQPLGNLLADELLLHLEELPLDLGQRRDIAGHGGHAGRALVQALAKLKLQVFQERNPRRLGAAWVESGTEQRKKEALVRPTEYFIIFL